jgi:hypothetical protein
VRALDPYGTACDAGAEGKAVVVPSAHIRFLIEV